jgi:GTPase Era involved in 16S rRNA processing
MNRVMNRAARSSLEGVDAGLLVIEAGRWDEETRWPSTCCATPASRWCWWSTRSIA